MLTAEYFALMACAGGQHPAAHAFVTNEADSSVTAIDISDPTNMAFVSELADATNLLAAGACAMDRAANVLWVCASGGSRVSAVDISNPASMSVLGSLNDATYLAAPAAIALAGSTAWVLEGSGTHLTAVSTSNPASPTRTGFVETAAGFTGGAALAVDAENGVAYCMVFVGGGFSPIRIVSVDIANPASPAVLDTLDLTGNTDTTGGLALSPDGATLYATYGPGDFSVIDVASPASMSESYNYGALFAGGGGRSLTYLPGAKLLACARLDDALKTLNVSNPASVTVIDTESGATYLDNAGGHAVDPYNRNAFVVSEDGDEITSYAIDGSGNFTFLDNYASATQLNGATAVALL